jgi:hypothetical protein
VPQLPGAYSSGTLQKDTRWRPAAGGGGIRQITLPEGASQTFQKFELVALSSGKVANYSGEADPAAAAVTAAGAEGDLVLGMALQKATGTTDTPIDVIIADDNVEFLLRVYNATATSAELQDVTVGDLAELFRYNGAGDIQTVISAAPNGTDGINKVVIVEKPNDRSATDQFPGVWVKVRPTMRALL